MTAGLSHLLALVAASEGAPEFPRPVGALRLVTRIVIVAMLALMVAYVFLEQLAAWKGRRGNGKATTPQG
jgi:hypothetical protein